MHIQKFTSQGSIKATAFPIRCPKTYWPNIVASGIDIAEYPLLSTTTTHAVHHPRPNSGAFIKGSTDTAPFGSVSLARLQGQGLYYFLNHKQLR